VDLTARIERDRRGEARLTVLAANASSLWSELAALGAGEPYPWPARLAWRALGTVAERLGAAGPQLVIVPTPTLVEELLVRFQLLPLGPGLTGQLVAERWEAAAKGRAGGLVAYRPPEGTLPEEALAVVPVNPEQLRDFQRRGVRLVLPIACDVEVADLDDVERLRDVVRARRRGEAVGDAVLAGFAERVFAELGLEDGSRRSVTLTASRHFCNWSRHEAARRESASRLTPVAPASGASNC
jgi:hypothetical protein